MHRSKLANKEGHIFSGLMLFLVLLAPGSTHDRGEPEFDVPLPNLTVKLGTDAAFTCIVKHLAEFRVAWLRSEDKAIIALHNHMVTHNPRYSVTHNGHNVWTLIIKNVQPNDTGSYMCQINTDPQRSQSGTLEVVVPPDIDDEHTSNDVIVTEGQSTSLRCKATGNPTPTVRWLRQDKRPLPVARELLANPTEKVDVWHGELLQTRPLTRSDNGPFLCQAFSSVPPNISKRVMVYVHFHPVIKVLNQLVAAPAGINVTLECVVEAIPRPVVSWFKKDGQLILNQVGKVWQETEQTKDYEMKLKLTIANLQSPFDFGDYNCSVGNSLGSDSAIIRLQELRTPPTTRPTTTTTVEYRIKHGKHNNDRDLNGNAIKHSKDKHKQGRNKSEHYHRELEEQVAEHITTSTAISPLSSVTVGGGMSKRNQKEASTRLHTPQFPGTRSSASAPPRPLLSPHETSLPTLIFLTLTFSAFSVIRI